MSRPVRRHFWVPTPGGAVATCLHTPSATPARPVGVVICPAFGYEYTHSHRSLVHLGDALAEAGFAVMRLDYLGTGDSQGDHTVPDLLQRWVESVRAVAQRLADMTGGAPPALVGLRLGSLLAGLASTGMEVSHFVAWHPVTSGRRWAREHTVVQRTGHPLEASPPVEAGAPDVLEAGGFVLRRATLEKLQEADLRQSRMRVSGEALVVDRSDLGPETRMAALLQEQGTPTRAVSVPGYLDMMAEPQYTVVPAEAISTIVDWLGGLCPPGPGIVLDGDVLEELTARRVAEWVQDGAGVVEELVRIPGGSSPLVGVLSGPPAQPGSAMDRRPAVLLVNAGSVHHVGPNRLYVELARHLARQGFATLRLDLRNLGDSRFGPCGDENHPYPTTAVEDVATAVTWLVEARGHPACIVAGLCSGAYTAFRAGVELGSLDIAGVVCMNPLTFSWREGMSLDTPDTHRTTRDAQYYSGAVRSWSKWKKLLRGEADVGYIVRFSVLRLGQLARTCLHHAADRAGLRRPDALAESLQRLQALHRPLHFVFSTNDPGHAILTAEGGAIVRRLVRADAIAISFVAGADHTFSRSAWRASAGRALLQGVRAMTSATARAAASVGGSA